MHTVVVPGIGGSDLDHWQSRWEGAADWTRIVPESWDEPDVADWMSALDVAVGETVPVIVAHSLGCLAAVRWTYANPHRTAGLFLVASPDPDSPEFPAIAAPFGLDFELPLPVPAILIYSADDAYCHPSRSLQFASTWGIPAIDVGAHGHLNAASNIGEWGEGRNLLTAFRAGLRPLNCRPTVAIEM